MDKTETDKRHAEAAKAQQSRSDVLVQSIEKATARLSAQNPGVSPLKKRPTL